MRARKLRFKCWKCTQEFELQGQIETTTDKQKWIVPCPKCGAVGTVKTGKYTITTVMRGETKTSFNFPYPIPTERMEES